MKISHLVGSFVIFAIVTSLFITIYTGLEDGYSIEREGDQNITYDGSMWSGISNTTQTGNIVEHFEQMWLIEGINGISDSITRIGNPGDFRDILGGLASLGLGILKTSLGILIAPVTVTFIITKFYGGDIPAYLLGGLVALLTVYIAYLLLSAYLRHDV